MGVLQRFLNIFRAKTNKVLDRVEDPRDTLDLSYEKQLENLQKMRRSIAEVATARKRIEIQANQLQQQAPSSRTRPARPWPRTARTWPARRSRRRAAIGAELTDLESQHDQIADQEEKLVETSNGSRPRWRFRTRKETLKATYTAAQAQTQIGEAVAGISGSMSDAGATMQRAQDKIAADAGAGRRHRRAPGVGRAHRPELEHRRHPGPAQQGAAATSQVERELAALKTELAAAPAPRPCPPAPAPGSRPATPAARPTRSALRPHSTIHHNPR